MARAVLRAQDQGAIWREAGWEHDIYEGADPPTSEPPSGAPDEPAAPAPEVVIPNSNKFKTPANGLKKLLDTVDTDTNDVDYYGPNAHPKVADWFTKPQSQNFAKTYLKPSYADALKAHLGEDNYQKLLKHAPQEHVNALTTTTQAPAPNSNKFKTPANSLKKLLENPHTTQEHLNQWVAKTPTNTSFAEKYLKNPAYQDALKGHLGEKNYAELQKHLKGSEAKPQTPSTTSITTPDMGSTPTFQEMMDKAKKSLQPTTQPSLGEQLHDIHGGFSAQNWNDYHAKTPEGAAKALKNAIENYHLPPEKVQALQKVYDQHFGDTKPPAETPQDLPSAIHAINPNFVLDKLKKLSPQAQYDLVKSQANAHQGTETGQAYADLLAQHFNKGDKPATLPVTPGPGMPPEDKELSVTPGPGMADNPEQKAALVAGITKIFPNSNIAKAPDSFSIPEIQKQLDVWQTHLDHPELQSHVAQLQALAEQHFGPKGWSPSAPSGQGQQPGPLASHPLAQAGIVDSQGTWNPDFIAWGKSSFGDTFDPEKNSKAVLNQQSLPPVWQSIAQQWQEKQQKQQGPSGGLEPADLGYGDEAYTTPTGGSDFATDFKKAFPNATVPIEKMAPQEQKAKLQEWLELYKPGGTFDSSEHYQQLREMLHKYFDDPDEIKAIQDQMGGDPWGVKGKPQFDTDTFLQEVHQADPDYWSPGGYGYEAVKDASPQSVKEKLEDLLDEQATLSGPQEKQIYQDLYDKYFGGEQKQLNPDQLVKDLADVWDIPTSSSWIQQVATALDDGDDAKAKSLVSDKLDEWKKASGASPSPGQEAVIDKLQAAFDKHFGDDGPDFELNSDDWDEPDGTPSAWDPIKPKAGPPSKPVDLQELWKDVKDAGDKSWAQDFWTDPKKDHKKVLQDWVDDYKNKGKLDWAQQMQDILDKHFGSGQQSSTPQVTFDQIKEVLLSHPNSAWSWDDGGSGSSDGLNKLYKVKDDPAAMKALLEEFALGSYEPAAAPVKAALDKLFGGQSSAQQGYTPSDLVTNGIKGSTPSWLGDAKHHPTNYDMYQIDPGVDAFLQHQGYTPEQINNWVPSEPEEQEAKKAWNDLGEEGQQYWKDYAAGAGSLPGGTPTSTPTGGSGFQAKNLAQDLSSIFDIGADDIHSDGTKWKDMSPEKAKSELNDLIDMYGGDYGGPPGSKTLQELYDKHFGSGAQQQAPSPQNFDALAAAKDYGAIFGVGEDINTSTLPGQVNKKYKEMDYDEFKKTLETNLAKTGPNWASKKDKIQEVYDKWFGGGTAGTSEPSLQDIKNYLINTHGWADGTLAMGWINAAYKAGGIPAVKEFIDKKLPNYEDYSASHAVKKGLTGLKDMLSGSQQGNPTLNMKVLSDYLTAHHGWGPASEANEGSGYTQMQAAFDEGGIEGLKTFLKDKLAFGGLSPSGQAYNGYKAVLDHIDQFVTAGGGGAGWDGTTTPSAEWFKSIGVSDMSAEDIATQTPEKFQKNIDYVKAHPDQDWSGTAWEKIIPALEKQQGGTSKGLTPTTPYTPPPFDWSQFGPEFKAVWSGSGWAEGSDPGMEAAKSKLKGQLDAALSDYPGTEKTQKAQALWNKWFGDGSTPSAPSGGASVDVDALKADYAALYNKPAWATTGLSKVIDSQGIDKAQAWLEAKAAGLSSSLKGQIQALLDKHFGGAGAGGKVFTPDFLKWVKDYYGTDWESLHESQKKTAPETYSVMHGGKSHLQDVDALQAAPQLGESEEDEGISAPAKSEKAKAADVKQWAANKPTSPADWKNFAAYWGKTQLSPKQEQAIYQGWFNKPTDPASASKWFAKVYDYHSKPSSGDLGAQGVPSWATASWAFGTKAEQEWPVFQQWATKDAGIPKGLGIKGKLAIWNSLSAGDKKEIADNYLPANPIDTQAVVQQLQDAFPDSDFSSWATMGQGSLKTSVETLAKSGYPEAIPIYNTYFGGKIPLPEPKPEGAEPEPQAVVKAFKPVPVSQLPDWVESQGGGKNEASALKYSSLQHWANSLGPEASQWFKTGIVPTDENGKLIEVAGSGGNGITGKYYDKSYKYPYTLIQAYNQLPPYIKDAVDTIPADSAPWQDYAGFKEWAKAQAQPATEIEAIYGGQLPPTLDNVSYAWMPGNWSYLDTQKQTLGAQIEAEPDPAKKAALLGVYHKYFMGGKETLGQALEKIYPAPPTKGKDAAPNWETYLKTHSTDAVAKLIKKQLKAETDPDRFVMLADAWAKYFPHPNNSSDIAPSGIKALTDVLKSKYPGNPIPADNLKSLHHWKANGGTASYVTSSWHLQDYDPGEYVKSKAAEGDEGGYVAYHGWTPPGAATGTFKADPAMLKAPTPNYAAPAQGPQGKYVQTLLDTVNSHKTAFSAQERQLLGSEEFQAWFNNAPTGYKQVFQHNPGIALEDFKAFMSGGLPYGEVPGGDGAVGGKDKYYDVSPFANIAQPGTEVGKGKKVPPPLTHNEQRNTQIKFPRVPDEQETLPLAPGEHWAPQYAPMPIYRLFPLSLGEEPQVPKWVPAKDRELWKQKQTARLRRIDEIINGTPTARNPQTDKLYFNKFVTQRGLDPQSAQELQQVLFSPEQLQLGQDEQWKHFEDFSKKMKAKGYDLPKEDIADLAQQLGVTPPLNAKGNYEHPELANLILDYIEDHRGWGEGQSEWEPSKWGGMGTHWTRDKDKLYNGVGGVQSNPKNMANGRQIPIMLSGLWGGQGEGKGSHGAYDSMNDSEREHNLYSGAPVLMRRLQIADPSGDFHDLIDPGPMSLWQPGRDETATHKQVTDKPSLATELKKVLGSTAGIDPEHLEALKPGAQADVVFARLINDYPEQKKALLKLYRDFFVGKPHLTTKPHIRRASVGALPVEALESQIDRLAGKSQHYLDMLQATNDDPLAELANGSLRDNDPRFDRRPVFRDHAEGITKRYYSPHEMNPPPPPGERDDIHWGGYGDTDDYLGGDDWQYWDRGNLPLHRGLMLDLRSPELDSLRRALLGPKGEEKRFKHKDEPPGLFDQHPSDVKAHPEGYDNRSLGHQILDHLTNSDEWRNEINSQGGLGPHWSLNEATANVFSGVASDPWHLPVKLKAEWRGLGEDPYRSNTGGSFPEENEVTMLPGANMNISSVKIKHPVTNKWHEVLADPEPRMAHKHAVQQTPEGLQLHYWPDHKSIQKAFNLADWDGGSFSAPAVTAHLGQGSPKDTMVGSLEWYPEYKYPGADNYKQGEVSMIQTHPDYRRHGIATAMFDHAKNFEPKLHHSELESGDGFDWARAEETRQARVAMPTYYHHTSDPDFHIDFDRKPGNEVLNRKLPNEGKGLWVSKDPEAWAHYQYRGRRPYQVELYSDDELGDGSNEAFVSGDQLRHMQVKNVTPKRGGITRAADRVALFVEPPDQEF